jgi:hypothetical protein
MPDENKNQQPDVRQAIADTAAELSQLFPTRDEVKTIAENAVPAELLNMDAGVGTGGDVLCRGKAAAGSTVPMAFWGKAVMALKYLTTHLTGRVEIKASTGIEITPDATPGSESLTFKNSGLTSLNGCTGAVTLEPGKGITGTVDTVAKKITIINDSVTPTGYLLTNLYFIDAGSGQKNLYADGVGSGDYYGQSVTGYLVPGGPVGGGGGGGGSGYSGTQTTYGRAYISGTNLVQDVIVWTFSNGLLQSVTPSGTNIIATLLSCDS